VTLSKVKEKKDIFMKFEIIYLEDYLFLPKSM